MFERTVWIDSEVNLDTLEIGRQIIKWNVEDADVQIDNREPIRIFIYSYGGNLEIQSAMIDIIEASDTPVYGYNMGIAASAACFIFMSCHKRFAMENATFLIHKGSAKNISGTHDQVISHVGQYDHQIKNLTDFIASHSNIDCKMLKIDTEWYLSAKQAIYYGFCDWIIENLSDIYG